MRVNLPPTFLILVLPWHCQELTLLSCGSLLVAPWERSCQRIACVQVWALLRLRRSGTVQWEHTVGVRGEARAGDP